MKQFKLAKEEIRPLVEGRGACIATDKITVEGLPVRFLYRAAPDNEVDSGWRFMSGFESDGYMDDPANHARSHRTSRDTTTSRRPIRPSLGGTGSGRGHPAREGTPSSMPT